MGSLLAVPPPPPGSQPLAGSMTVDLLGNSLTQWATHVQDVASGMILPPEVEPVLIIRHQSSINHKIIHSETF